MIVVEQLRGKGRGRRFLRGHHTPITTLALQSDGCGLASASRCHGNWTAEVRAWDLEDNQQCSNEVEREGRGEGEGKGGERGRGEGLVIIVTNPLQVLPCPAHTGEVTVMAYSPDNRFLVAAVGMCVCDVCSA